MTQRTCIMIADAARARLFVHERETSADGARDELAERAVLENPARRLTMDELFSDTRTGSDRAGGRHFGFQDHRDAHIANIDDVFARAVSEQLDNLAATCRAQRVVLCASPHMLGLIRRHLGRLGGAKCDELAKDLVKLSPTELRAQLAAYGVLPKPPARAAMPSS